MRALLVMLLGSWGLSAGGCRCKGSAVGAAESALLAAERAKCRALEIRLRRLGARAIPPALCSRGLPKLPDDAVFIAFHQVRRTLHRFVRARGHTRRLAALDLTQLEPLLIKLRDELEFGSLSDVQPLWKLLHRGYQRLLADASPELSKAKRLLVSADGLVHVVPLHALLVGEKQPIYDARPARRMTFVASRWEVTYVPCAALARSRGAPPWRAELVAPSYGRRAERKALAGALREAAWMKVPFGDRLTLHRGAKATPARLLAALAQSGTAVHFAGHGLANLRAGQPPELIFPDVDPGLSVRQLAARPVRAPLVVLASCTTAHAARFRAGKRRFTETTLPQALLAAGARSVVAASWSVKDGQSAAQMRTFYAHLLAEGPAAALTAAYRERIAHLRPPHPRFWGFYAVFGSPGW